MGGSSSDFLNLSIKQLFNCFECSIIQTQAQVKRSPGIPCQTGEMYFRLGETREQRRGVYHWKK